MFKLKAELKNESHRRVKGSFILIGFGNEEKERRKEAVIMGKQLGGGKVLGPHYTLWQNIIIHLQL